MGANTPIKAVLFDAAGVLTGPFSVELVEGALAAGADATVLAEVLFPIFASAGTGDSIGNQLERGEVSLDDFFASFGEHERDLRVGGRPCLRHLLRPTVATKRGHAPIRARSIGGWLRNGAGVEQRA